MQGIAEDERRNPYLAEEENELQDMTIEQLVTLRKVTKTKHTRVMKELDELIRKEGSASEVDDLREELLILMEECIGYNAAILAHPATDEDTKEVTLTWNVKIREATTPVLTAAARYTQGIRDRKAVPIQPNTNLRESNHDEEEAEE